LTVGIFILCSVSILAIIVFMFTRKIVPQALLKIRIRLIFGFFMLAGFLIIISESVRIDLFLAMRHWPTAEAKVVSSRVEGKRAFHPEIIYEYRVGEKIYTGTTDMGVPGFGTKANRLNVAETNVTHYPAGTVITVHYDPNDPSVSQLKIVPTYTVFLLLSVGSILLGVGLWGVLAGIAQKNS
jgi:hypothetical protein